MATVHDCRVRTQQCWAKTSTLTRLHHMLFVSCAQRIKLPLLLPPIMDILLCNLLPTAACRVYHANTPTRVVLGPCQALRVRLLLGCCRATSSVLEAAHCKMACMS